MPSAGKQVFAGLVLAVLLLVSGLVWVVDTVLFGDHGSSSSTSAPASSSTPVATVTVTATPSLSLPPEPTASSTPSSSSSATATPDADAYSELPPEPWNDPSIDFGFLTKARFKNGSLVLTVNRARFLGGDAAVEANGGIAPDNDYLVVDESSKTRTFVVDPDAVLVGTDVLDGDSDPTTSSKVTRSNLRTRATEAIAAGHQPMVWLRHANASDLDGPVTYLQEQYVP